MNLFTFAISSIVDTNTGYLSANKQFIDVDKAASHAREIRAESGNGVFTAIRSAIASLLERRRQRVQERRGLNALLRMNDHMLGDIGLTRGDLVAVEMGSITLQDLQAERRPTRQDDIIDLEPAPATAPLEVEDEAANEPAFDDKKIA